jgi:hypothetical protein
VAILIGLAVLAVASLLVIGVGYGNLFVCVFLTLPIVAVGLIAAGSGNTLGTLVFPLVTFGMLIAIWAPFLYRRHRIRA